jgi:hypothetical protein
MRQGFCRRFGTFLGLASGTCCGLLGKFFDLLARLGKADVNRSSPYIGELLK